MSVLGGLDKAGPRTLRDKLVDVAIFVVTAGLAVLFYFSNVDSTVRHVSDGEYLLDALLGGVALLSLWWRRRSPILVASFTAALAFVSSAAGAVALVALFSLAVHRRWPVVAVLAVPNVVSGCVYVLYRPQDITFLSTVGINVAACAIVVAWGMFVRARRQLVWTWRERAEKAEAEQRMLAERARLAERTRIAREMHDVLAHRLSLLALHAGGLQLRPDLPAQEVRQTAELLRSTAHSALEELREVIGVLRDGGGDAPAAPQPTLRDVARLVEDARATGARVDYDSDVFDAEPPGSLGRDVYRIVQEALTNIAKHARGTATTVRVTGIPGGELRVTVRNRMPVTVAASPAIPGSGSGLVGLQERVTLAGGTLAHGRNDRGEFEIDARLRWPG